MNARNEYSSHTIGNNLRRLREENGFSVEEVREYLHLGSVQSVYKYEYGINYPPGDTLIALLELYHAEVADLIIDDTANDTNAS